MRKNPKVHFIPAKPQKVELRVGIYCRFSTNRVEQLNSLSAQVSSLTRLTLHQHQIGCLLIFTWM